MRNSHSSLQSAPFFRVLSSPDVPAKHQETAAGWGGKNSDGRALDNWYDFDSSRTPSKPQSKKERLARLLKNFECSEHNADCALLACLEREKADELSEIQSEQTQKSTLNKDYEVGALLLDLNRGRIFGDNVTATRIKKKVDEMPLVAILPLVKQLHDSISDLPESRHSKAVKNTFNMLTQGLAFLALDDSDAPQVMALIDKTYREGFQEELYHKNLAHSRSKDASRSLREKHIQTGRLRRHFISTGTPVFSSLHRRHSAPPQEDHRSLHEKIPPDIRLAKAEGHT